MALCFTLAESSFLECHRSERLDDGRTDGWMVCGGSGVRGLEE